MEILFFSLFRTKTLELSLILFFLFSFNPSASPADSTLKKKKMFKILCSNVGSQQSLMLAMALIFKVDSPLLPLLPRRKDNGQTHPSKMQARSCHPFFYLCFSFYYGRSHGPWNSIWSPAQEVLGTSLAHPWLWLIISASATHFF